MSGNGKQVQLAPNQPPRYACVPRPLTPQRADAFPVSGATVAGPYVSGGGGAGPHMQAGGMRGLPQPSTPPQQEHQHQHQLKQPLYAQGGVRAHSYQHSHSYRGAPPQQQAVVPRAASHHRQQGAGAWPGQVVYNMAPMFLPGHLHGLPPAPYQQQPQRAQFYTQSASMPAMMQQQPAYYNYANGPPQQQYLYGGAAAAAAPPGPLQLGGGAGRPAPAQLSAQGLAQSSPPQHFSARYSAPMQHPPPASEKKRRSHAIAIVDPKSGKDVTNDILEDDHSETVSEAGDRQMSQQDENVLAVVEEFARLVSSVAKDSVDEQIKRIEKLEIECESHIPPLQENLLNQQTFEDVPVEIKQVDMEIIDDKPIKQNQLCEHSDTPVVSAISNSPEIVPKQSHTSIKQKHNDNISVENKKSNQIPNKIVNKHNKQLSAIENTSDEINNLKNEKMDSREFQAQHILTSALLPTKPADEEIKRNKIEDQHIDHFPVESEKKIDIAAPVQFNKPKNSVSNSQNAEPDKNPEKKESSPVTTKSSNKTVNRESPPSTENQNTQKAKSESKRNKSRSNNEKGERNSIQSKKIETEQSEGKSTTIYSSNIENSINESINNNEPIEPSIPSSSNVDNAASVSNDITPEICMESKLEVLQVNNAILETDAIDNVSNDSNVVEPPPPKTDEVPEMPVEIENGQEEAPLVENAEQVEENANPAEQVVEVVQVEPNVGKPHPENKPDPDGKPDMNHVLKPSDKPPPKIILRYSYKDDQWSPLNTAGKRCYDTDFLMLLRNDPNSKKKPDNLNQLEIVSDVLARQPRNNSDVARSVMMRQTSDLLPGFVKMSSHGATPNRKSQHGKPTSKGINTPGSGLGNRPNIIHVNLSLRSDVKLNETENAWKPSRMRATTLEEEEVATQELYKTFRSVLNKLTPQKFDTLIEKVRKLNIDTEERLKGVINLVFEKAIDEPNFSLAYALMCKELEQIKVKIPNENDKDDRFVSFRALILGRCQMEFEKEDKTTKTRQKEIDECTDPEKKKELVLNLEEEERKIRRRSVGNVRFIGELYKQNLITVPIIMHCIKQLLLKIEEETLECLCKLLTTIGKDLEKNGGVNLQACFNNMKSIVDGKEKRVSSRVRFMLQDVIDLRLSHWIPRQQVVNPKTMDQIKLEVEMEQKSSMCSNFSSPTNNTRKDDRPSNMNKRGGSKSVTEEGWSPVPSRNTRNKQTPYVVDSGKLSRMCTVTPITLTSLQPSTQSLWGKGSVVNKKAENWPASHKSTTNASSNRKPAMETSNIFMALDNQQESNNRSEGPARKMSYKSKGASIERSTFKSDIDDQASNVSIEATLSKVKEILAHAHSEDSSIILSKIQENFVKDEMPIVIKELLLWGFECNKTESMQLIGEITGSLVEDETITPSEFLSALKQTIDTSSSYFTKAGNLIWDLLGGFIWAHMKKHNLKLEEIHHAFTKVIELDKGFELLSAIILEILKKSPNDAKLLWQKSILDLSDWMSEERVDQFLEEFPLKWIKQKDLQLSPEDACSHMLKLMQEGESRDAIKKWIDKRIGDAVQEHWFIRALMEAVHIYGLCPNGLAKPRFDSNETKNRLETYYPLLSTYVAGQERQELECLFAIQHLMHKLEHPQGITVQLFECLWENSEIISQEGFYNWEKNKDPKEQEGKGVMLKTLTSFFTSLHSADDSSDEATSVIEDKY